MNINSKKPKQIRTYKKITDVAIVLFVKYGVQGTSMAMIAKKAGIATGSIYNYFENKEKLINEIFENICNQAVDYVGQDISTEGSVRERFEAIVRREIAYKMKFPGHFQFITQYTYSPLILKEIQAGNKPEHHPMAQVFEDGRNEGIIQPLPDEDLFFFLFGAMNSWFLWKDFNNKTISETDISHVLQMSWRAISVSG